MSSIGGFGRFFKTAAPPQTKKIQKKFKKIKIKIINNYFLNSSSSILMSENPSCRPSTWPCSRCCTSSASFTTPMSAPRSWSCSCTAYTWTGTTGLPALSESCRSYFDKQTLFGYFSSHLR
jgi:hypothetical protein